MTIPAVVQSVVATGSSATLTGVTAGNAVVAIVAGMGAAFGTLTSITDSVAGQTFINDSPLYVRTGDYGSGGEFYSGAWRIAYAAAGNHTITVSIPDWTLPILYLVEVSGINAFDFATAVSNGSGAVDSATVNTGSGTPSAANDLLLAQFTSNLTGVTYSALTNGFTQLAASSAATGRSSALVSLVDSATSAISAGATASSSTYTNGYMFGYKAGISLPTPTITSVNGGSSIAEGTTAVPVAGTNFASGMTAAIVQPGGVSVSQAFTYTDATDGTFNLTMEPGTGDQLAFTDSTYTTSLAVTANGNTSTPFSVTLVPPAGLIFQTLSSINPNSSQTIQTSPPLVAGDQLEAAGDAAGTTAAPPGLILNNDATWQFSAGNAPADFYVRAYDATNKVWGAYALQTVSGGVVATSAVYKNIYEVSPTGLVQWVHYIPIKYVTVTATEVNRFDDNGAIGVNVLSSVTGLTAWVDYTPVVQSSGTKQWSYDATGYVPVMRMN